MLPLLLSIRAEGVQWNIEYFDDLYRWLLCMSVNNKPFHETLLLWMLDLCEKNVCA